ncbi:hypothetical protein M514_24365 [Trichuris suis]|uniref:Uncharacterized protein n=1 Tax=Trichuris suis TaxID=68888 RepID=A0A085N1U3_9BILA|nr:hypothetical protein M514_24365 [Trichuris suis]
MIEESFVLTRLDDGENVISVTFEKHRDRLKTTVCRKPAHSERYLHFSSHHLQSVMIGLIIGIVERARAICSEEFLSRELGQIKTTFFSNGYPAALISSAITHAIAEPEEHVPRPTVPLLILPCYKGLGAKIKRMRGTIGFQVYFKSAASLRSIVRNDKIRLAPNEKPGVTYEILCTCSASYIGETGNTLSHRYDQRLSCLNRCKNAVNEQKGLGAKRRGRPRKLQPNDAMDEAIKASAIVEHAYRYDGQLYPNIIAVEPYFQVRKIKETLYVRHNEVINSDKGTEVAFNRVHGYTPATYESCSTAAFKHGRTEAVRPATEASNCFVRALLNVQSPMSKAELKKMLFHCSKVHSNLVKQASMGKGFDRHMFAMKMLAERRGDRVPDLFIDETYRLANHFTLSTSSLTSDSILLGGFGPVVPDGYGIGYSVNDEQLGCILTAYTSKRNLDDFVESLKTLSYVSIDLLIIFSMNFTRNASFIARSVRCVKCPLRRCCTIKDDTAHKVTPRMVMNEVSASPQYYFTDDEKSLRTSATSLQDTAGNDYLCIFSYNDGLILEGEHLRLHTNATATFEQVATLDEITEESISLLTMVEPKPDLVVLGAGDKENVGVLEKRLRSFLRENKLSAEIMATPDACPMINYLNADQRYVVGLLFPVSNLSKERFSRLDSNYERALAREMDQSVTAQILGIRSKSVPNALRELLEERRQQLKEELVTKKTNT